VLGFALGPLLWAPLSEIYGRQIIFFFSFLGFTAFCAGSAGANSIGTLLVLRFFAGSFGSSPLTNAGGVVADIFPAHERGLAMSVFALAPSMGPTLGPFCAGFLSENQGWRWVMGLLAIFAGVMWIAGALFVPETYGPVILRKRADKLSHMTGKVHVVEADRVKGRPSLKKVLPTALIRPWILLFKEPIVLLLSIYIAIIYGSYQVDTLRPCMLMRNRHIVLAFRSVSDRFPRSPWLVRRRWRPAIPWCCCWHDARDRLLCLD
jgi:multidrug resistance protein